MACVCARVCARVCACFLVEVVDRHANNSSRQLRAEVCGQFEDVSKIGSVTALKEVADERRSAHGVSVGLSPHLHACVEMRISAISQMLLIPVTFRGRGASSHVSSNQILTTKTMPVAGPLTRHVLKAA